MPPQEGQYGSVEDKLLPTGELVRVRKNNATGRWEEIGTPPERSGPFRPSPPFGEITGLEPPPNIPLSTRFKLGFATTPEQKLSLKPEAESGEPSALRRFLGPPSQLVGQAPELIGMGAGGLITGAITKSPSATIAGAGTGATIGKGFQQFIGEEVLGLPPPTIEERAGQLGTSFVTGAGAEVLGLGAQWFIRGGFLKKAVTPSGRAGRKWTAENFPDDVSLTIAQVTDNAAVDISENVAGAGFFGSRILRHVKHTSEQITQGIKTYFGIFGEAIPPDKLGKAVMEALDRGFDAAKLPAISLRTKMYKDALKAGPDGTQLMIPMKDLRAAHLALTEDALGSTELGIGVLRKLARTGVLTQKRSASGQFKPLAIDVETAINLRTLMGQIWRASAKGENRQLTGNAARLFGQVDNALKSSLEKAGLLATFERQNRIFKGAEERFKPELLKALTRNAAKAPERFVRGVAGADRVTLIKQLRKAVGKEPEFQQLQRATLEDIWKKSLAEVELEGVGELPSILGHKLANRAFSPSGYGRDYMLEMFDQGTVDFITQAANALRVQQAKQLTGVGGAAIQFAQIPAAAELVGGITGRRGFRFAAGATIIGPNLLARFATNPKAQRWILDGLRTPAGTAEGIAIGAKLLQLLSSEFLLPETPFGPVPSHEPTISPPPDIQ